MKKLTTIFVAILFASFMITSCGGKSKETTDTTEDTTLMSSDTTATTEEATTTTTEEPAATEEAATESKSDCDQFIVDYEEFVNDYIVLVKKMKANPSDMTVMTEYTEMASNLSTMQSDAKECTDPKYATKLAKLATKLASAAAGM